MCLKGTLRADEKEVVLGLDGSWSRSSKENSSFGTISLDIYPFENSYLFYKIYILRMAKVVFNVVPEV